MQKKDLPPDNKFCYYPWRGAHIMPDGNVVACCHQTYGHYGVEDFPIKQNLADKSLEKIRISDSWTRLRKDLVEGKRAPECEYCWQLEDRGLPSMRTQRNRYFDEHGMFADLDIEANGTMDQNDPVGYWDIRDNNICNLKCIMCGPGLSSLWNQEAIDNHGTDAKNYNVKRPIGDKAVFHVNDVSKEKVEDIIERHIDKAKMFYFAGGEPLVNPTHWKILDLLIEKGLTNVKLTYNSNLQKLTWNKKNALEYWKKFDDVQMSASIDATGKVAEYSRTGTKWKTLDANFSKCMEIMPRDTAVSATVSLLTLDDFPNLMKWVGQKQIHTKNFIYHNVLVSPRYLNINILPKWYRDKKWQEINDVIDGWNQDHVAVLKGHSYAVLEKKIMEEEDPEEVINQRTNFKNVILQLDRVRKTNFCKVYPDLAEWFESIPSTRK